MSKSWSSDRPVNPARVEKNANTRSPIVPTKVQQPSKPHRRSLQSKTVKKSERP